MDVKFNIFPTSDSFSRNVGEPTNTKDHGDINVIEDKKMMVINGKKYKFDNKYKKQKWCGPGIYVDKIFMGKNAWVPLNVPVGYKCLIRKGQHVLKYARTIFFRYNTAGKLKVYVNHPSVGNKEAEFNFTDMGKWIKIFTKEYIPKGSFKWIHNQSIHGYTGIKVPQNRGNSWKCDVKLYRYIDTANTAYTYFHCTGASGWIRDGVAYDDVLLEKIHDKDDTTGEIWNVKLVPGVAPLIVSRNGLLTYYAGRIDYKIPDTVIYNACMKFAKDLLDDNINTSFVDWILNKKHLRYYFQMKCKRRYSPEKLSQILRNKTAGKPTRITAERDRIVNKTRRMWKNIYSDMPGDATIPNINSTPGVFSYSAGDIDVPFFLSVKRKFIQQKDAEPNVVNVVRYTKLNYIDFRLIRRIDNDYVFDQNSRNIRINYSNYSDHYSWFPDYKRITIDIK